MTADINRLFGEKVKRERTERDWSIRDLCEKAGGLSPATVHRAEKGTTEVWLSVAARIAVALGTPLGDLVATPVCRQCDGSPPAGFICSACGRGAGG